MSFYFLFPFCLDCFYALCVQEITSEKHKKSICEKHLHENQKFPYCEAVNEYLKNQYRL